MNIGILWKYQIMKKFNDSPEILIVAFGLIFASIIMLVALFYTPPLATATVIYSNDNTSSVAIDESRSSVTNTANFESSNSVTSSKTNSTININTATVEELAALKGIGETKAQKIIDFRNSNGNFKSTAEIMNVSGIGDKTYENIKNHICV